LAFSSGYLITGLPTHSVGGQTSNGYWCLLSSSIVYAAGRVGWPPGTWAVGCRRASRVGDQAVDTAQRASTVTSRQGDT